MSDETEGLRRTLVQEINSDARNRLDLERYYGQVWDTKQLQEDFSVQGFMAPFVVVKRKADGKIGSLTFQHHPRFYWGWTEDR